MGTSVSRGVECPSCHEVVVPSASRRRFWAMIVTFWVFSLLFGIGATFSTGWGALMLVMWLALACAVALSIRRGAWMACPRCGTSLMEPGPRPPVEVV